MTIKDKIIAPFEIEVEENQYILYKPVTVNVKGEPTVQKDVQGYFTSLGNALLRIVNKQMSATEKNVTVKQYMAEYKKVSDSFLKHFELMQF